MTEAQKLAYDAEQNGIQTVVISAKRLTTEQKPRWISKIKKNSSSNLSQRKTAAALRSEDEHR
jgi:hypothetical protein